MKKTQTTELLTRFTAPMASVEEHMATGKVLREKVPHDRHVDYWPAPKRQTAVKKSYRNASERLSP